LITFSHRKGRKPGSSSPQRRKGKKRNRELVELNSLRTKRLRGKRKAAAVHRKDAKTAKVRKETEN